MADNRQLLFEERAYGNYREEIEAIGKIVVLLQEKDSDDIEEYRQALSCDTRWEVTILLSWGGPSDGYKIYFNEEKEAIEGCYFFADWFEYKEFKLTDEELDTVIAVYPVSPDC